MTVSADDLRRRVRELLAVHDPATMERLAFLRARFDAGLAWVSYPVGLGGLGAPRALQPGVDADLAALGTRAVRALSGPQGEAARDGLGVDGDDWVGNGQQVWTSMAHEARWAILIARTDPAVPKHEGITYFVCDMTAEGVDVRPLRQLTGEAEFNEVFLNDVRIPDAHRIGGVGQGWQVARTTLMNERVAIGGGAMPREAGMIGVVATTWRERPEVRTAGQHDTLMQLWVAAEAARIAAQRLREQLAAGQPGAEGSAVKFAYSRLTQAISGFELELLGEEGLRYDDWAMRRPSIVDWSHRSPGYRYLRAKGNSIEGGTSEILANIIAERVLGLPSEPRVDKDVAWKDLPR